MANMTFKTNLLPNSDLGYSLGSSDQRWKINDLAGGPIEYIVDTKTGTSSAWTGVTKDSTLAIGKVIAFKVTNEPRGNASLQLTFTNPPEGEATATAAIPVYLNNTRVTTHYANGSVILMVYDGTNWRSTDYWNSNSRDAGYGKITPQQSDAETAITPNTTQLVSTTYTEAMKVAAGNKWVQFAGTNGGNGADVLTVGHSLSGVTAGNYGDSSAQTPGYGGTFNVPYISVDAAGHVTGISAHTVKIPASDNTTYTFSNGTAGNFIVTPSGGTAQTVSIGKPVTAGTADVANSVAWGNVTGKPSTFAPATHDHSQIITVGDQRSTATTPNNYSNKIIFQGLKSKDTINSPSDDTYSYLIGLRGWSDASGGDSHELAFNNTGVYWRHGATATWGTWNRLVTNSGTWGISITGSAGSATKATQDESGNNIKASYAASFSISDHTITLKNKNGVSLGTVTVPDNNTDTKVTQTNQTGANDYRVLLSGSANDTTATEGANKSTNLRFNPSTKVFSVGGDIEATGDLELTGDAYLNSETYADSLTASSLLVTGAAAFTNTPTAPTPATTSNDTSIATTAFVKNNLGGLSGAMHFKGTTTTTMSDGLTTAAVTIGGSSYTPAAGDVVLYSDSEFVWTGSAWERLGRDSSFKTTQTAVTGATTASTATATTFVSAIEQDANGVIKYTTKVLPTYNNYSHPTTTAVDAAAVKVGKDSLGHVVLGSALTYSDVGAASASHGTHVTFASSGTPAALGTASHGSATTVARSDHVHPKPTPADIGAAAASHGTHVTYSSTTPKALGTAAVGTENAVARGDHVHPKPSLTDLGAASSSHVHGNITNDGKITATATIASGDKIVIVDSDTTAASKITGSSITFGTSANYALANNGTWQAFSNNAGTVTQITAGTGLTTTSGGSTDGGSITNSGTIYLTKTGTSTGSFGMSSNTTGSNNTKINIPYITVDAYGRITSISNKEYTSVNTEGTDTKNTAGSTDTSSKIFLVGATSQTANAQTYSDNQVYATNGQLDANKVRIAEHVTLQYNTTTNALDFVFA